MERKARGRRGKSEVKRKTGKLTGARGEDRGGRRGEGKVLPGRTGNLAGEGRGVRTQKGLLLNRRGR